MKLNSKQLNNERSYPPAEVLETSTTPHVIEPLELKKQLFCNKILMPLSLMKNSVLILPKKDSQNKSKDISLHYLKSL